MIALIAALSLSRPSEPRQILPNPNGYDDLVRGGQSIRGKVSAVRDLDGQMLRDLISTNTQALRLLRLGLSRPAAVPTDDAITNLAGNMSSFIALKQLAMLLAAEGRLAEIECRNADATRSYVDAIALGVAMSRGGVMINRLVGISCEGIGMIPLTKLVPKLSCEDIRPTLLSLQKIDSHPVLWTEILKNENRFVRSQLGKYPNPIKLVSDLWQARSAQKSCKERHDATSARLRLLIMELALRCYRAEHGNSPPRAGDLVPGFLPRIPIDPFSNRPFVYRPQGTNWLLYSVGPDGKDDGGTPIVRSLSGDYLIGIGTGNSKRMQSKGDLFYDSPW